MVHPEYRVLKPQQKVVVSDTLTPIYPMTEGVQQGRLRNLVGQALEMMRKAPPDELLPESVRDKHGMPSLVEALAFLHQPPPEVDLATVAAGKHPCQLRLSFEELLAHYMSLRNLRNLAKKENAFALARGGAAVV
jgi:ATP-dependent DNA helicase RecG